MKFPTADMIMSPSETHYKSGLHFKLYSIYMINKSESYESC